MTYVTALPCVDVKDRACIDECPVDCIYEGQRMLYIHPASIRSRADRAEAKLEVVENERDRLLAERDSLRQERDQLLARSEVTENGDSSSKS
ncbi:MAG: hypothetical protein L0G94_08850 [Brachybacterium sp.]|uniref:4Fe-4S dicluster domain-containing protein n=1 Tax=Brachybacterium sp. TaxID=1891286 RepID=UPI002649B146|nr:hypothetical protein [Brachybacterium sp.]MDN5686774.1 hypothetical protein [Brachybacterium sp.]